METVNHYEVTLRSFFLGIPNMILSDLFSIPTRRLTCLKAISFHLFALQGLKNVLTVTSLCKKVNTVIEIDSSFVTPKKWGGEEMSCSAQPSFGKEIFSPSNPEELETKHHRSRDKCDLCPPPAAR